MRRTVLALTGIAGAALLAAQVQARPPGPPPFGDGARRAVMAMLHGGDLTPAQRDAARAKLDAERDDADATLDALRAANEQLTTQLLGGDPPDEAALRAALDQIATLRAALMDKQVQTALAVRGMLSADQLAAAATDAPPDHDCRGPREP